MVRAGRFIGAMAVGLAGVLLTLQEAVAQAPQDEQLPAQGQERSEEDVEEASHNHEPPQASQDHEPPSEDEEPPAHDQEQARIHFDAGRLHYDHGRFDEAAREFTVAYEMSGNAALLYNLFLVHRDANRMEEAVAALEGYLEKVTDQPGRATLQARLRAIKAKLQAQADALEAGMASATPKAEAEEDAQALEAPASEITAAPSEDATDVRGRPQRLAGPIGIMAAGAALGLGAVVTGILAKRAESDLHAACPARTSCDPALESTLVRARRLGVTTDVLWMTGVAAAVGGAVWFLFKRRQSRETRRPAVSVGCGPDGCGLGYERAF
jgi:tetratricopeptide (TPR) repeat protein